MSNGAPTDAKPVVATPAATAVVTGDTAPAALTSFHGEPGSTPGFHGEAARPGSDSFHVAATVSGFGAPTKGAGSDSLYSHNSDGTRLSGNYF